MSVIIFWTVTLFLIASVNGAVLPVLFPDVAVFPFLVVGFAVALTLSRGFVPALPSVIAVGFIADAVSLGRMGMLPALLVIAAYAASFFSRRFAFEHRGATLFFSGILVAAVSVAYPILTGLFFGTAASIHSIPSWSVLTWTVIGSTLSFSLFRIGLLKFDERVAYLGSQQILSRN